MTASPFALPSEVKPVKGPGYADIPMGTRHPTQHRYKLPLLPGETGTKSCPPGVEPWVPGGVQSMTNLAASISDTKALGWWELEQALIGIGLHPGLAEALRNTVYDAKERGVDFQALKDEPGKVLCGELAAITERAKDISGGNAARDAGIVRHDVWEIFGKFGQQTGTDQINTEIQAVRQLLDAAGFEIIPELCERVVRNVVVKAAGRFDNILMHRRTGRLLMADLKTKRKPFWTWLEMDGQLAGYAFSEWMLETIETSPGVFEVVYVPGPMHHVDLTEGVILHMPSDGAEPRLRKADLTRGWHTLQLARQVCTVRSDGKSAGRERESYWPTS